MALLTEKIVDTIADATVEILETKNPTTGETKVVVRGEFGRADKPTANKRLYPHSLWESQIDRLQSSLSSRKVVGELDHPSDGRTSLQRISHVITKLSLEGDLVIGEAEILDTTLGRDLKVMLAAGIPIGISSRGYGSVKPSKDGVSIVDEADYKLVTFDFVAEPADETAYPNVFFEGAEIPLDAQPLSEGSAEKDLDAKMDAILAAGAPAEPDPVGDKFKALMAAGPVASDMEALRAEFKERLLDRMSDLRESIYLEVEEKLLADPKVGGAKAALATIQAALAPFATKAEDANVVGDLNKMVESLQEELRASRAEVADLSAALKETGYRFFVEKAIANKEDAAILRRVVGDVSKYANTDEITSVIEAASSDIASRREKMIAERAERNATEKALREENAALREAMESSAKKSKAVRLRLYAEQALTNHPKAEKIRRVLETTSLDSEDQVDKIMESFRIVASDPEEVATTRDRVRALVKGGSSSKNSDSGPERPIQENYNGLGASLVELKKLSGQGR